jgi:hypothetical protein
VGTDVFPPEGGAALAARDVPDGMVARGHLPVYGLALDNVDTVRGRQQRIKTGR